MTRQLQGLEPELEGTRVRPVEVVRKRVTAKGAEVSEILVENVVSLDDEHPLK